MLAFQNELGEVVFVDLPEVGASVSKGETFGVVESVKAASDVYSPVSGEVVDTNAELTSNPGLVRSACCFIRSFFAFRTTYLMLNIRHLVQVNSGPFSEGWIMKVKLSDPSQLDSLLDDAAYTKHCEASAH